MAILINCDNRKCLKQTPANLNTKTDQVICSDCNNVITNVTDFLKRQLKFAGQTLKHNTQAQPFAVKCPSCENNGTPKLEKGHITCSSCKKEITNISPFFVKLLKEYLSKNE